MKYEEQLKHLFDQGLSLEVNRNDEVLGDRVCNIQLDDPALDATDGAHPAWHRGSDYTWSIAQNRLKEVINSVNEYSNKYQTIEDVIKLLLFRFKL